MKKFVQYGAGNIGRGFIGQLFARAGYEVVFIDVNMELIGRMNADHRYPVRVVSAEGERDEWVEGVRGVNGMDAAAVAEEIATADVMATAVGVNILPRIAAPIARGLERRWAADPGRPLNIIICENLLGADAFLRDLVEKAIDPAYVKNVEILAGFVEASIGRMVPVMTPEMQDGNILRVCVEPFAQLPVDRNAFKGEIPTVQGMKAVAPFEFYIHRKLFIHNMGHALTAYLGKMRGYEYIAEANADPLIKLLALRAMLESGAALAAEHGEPLDGIIAHIEDLQYRFGNPRLGDTVARVGRDTLRKLSANDRLAGAALLCIKHGIRPVYIALGIAAGLHFNSEGDEGSQKVRDRIAADGIDTVLRDLCGIDPTGPTGRDIREFFEMTDEGKNPDDLLRRAERIKNA